LHKTASPDHVTDNPGEPLQTYISKVAMMTAGDSLTDVYWRLRCQVLWF